MNFCTSGTLTWPETFAFLLVSFFTRQSKSMKAKILKDSISCWQKKTDWFSILVGMLVLKGLLSSQCSSLSVLGSLVEKAHLENSVWARELNSRRARKRAVRVEWRPPSDLQSSATSAPASASANVMPTIAILQADSPSGDDSRQPIGMFCCPAACLIRGPMYLSQFIYLKLGSDNSYFIQILRIELVQFCPI